VVADTGKTLRPDAFKPVNLPEAVGVEEDATGEPAAVRAERNQTVKSIEDRWRIDDEWWRSEEISRMYYVVLFKSGQRIVVFKDLIKGNWWKQGG
jgi:hypothetical protein